MKWTKLKYFHQKQVIEQKIKNKEVSILQTTKIQHINFKKTSKTNKPGIKYQVYRKYQVLKWGTSPYKTPTKNVQTVPV